MCEKSLIMFFLSRMYIRNTPEWGCFFDRRSFEQYLFVLDGRLIMMVILDMVDYYAHTVAFFHGLPLIKFLSLSFHFFSRCMPVMGAKYFINTWTMAISYLSYKEPLIDWISQDNSYLYPQFRKSVLPFIQRQHTTRNTNIII